MKNNPLRYFSILLLFYLYGCTDKEPVVEQKPKETVFQGYIDVLEKAEEVNRIAETRVAQQRKAIEEQSQ